MGNVLTKQHQGGPIQTMSYDLADRLTTSQYGVAITSYTYDAGNLTQVNVNGVNTYYAYDGENRMTKRTDPDLRVATYTYGADGLRRSAVEPGGSVRTMVWDGANYLGEVN
jgi:YD repeat-containing protein